MASKTQHKTTGISPNLDTSKGTKIGKVIAMLKRKQGATLDQMVKATGWQPHTTRAAMTGLEKKGHTIQREVVDGASLYRITESA